MQLPKAARKEVDRELARLKRAGREGMEAQVIRTYLETIAELPWNERSSESLSIPEAARILEEDHYALGDVKDRVLEFLAVRQLRQASLEARRREREAAAAEATVEREVMTKAGPAACVSCTFSAALRSMLPVIVPPRRQK